MIKYDKDVTHGTFIFNYGKNHIELDPLKCMVYPRFGDIPGLSSIESLDDTCIKFPNLTLYYNKDRLDSFEGDTSEELCKDYYDCITPKMYIEPKLKLVIMAYPYLLEIHQENLNLPSHKTIIYTKNPISDISLEELDQLKESYKRENKDIDYIHSKDLNGFYRDSRRKGVVLREKDTDNELFLSIDTGKIVKGAKCEWNPEAKVSFFLNENTLSFNYNLIINTTTKEIIQVTKEAKSNLLIYYLKEAGYSLVDASLSKKPSPIEADKILSIPQSYLADGITPQDILDLFR